MDHQVLGSRRSPVGFATTARSPSSWTSTNYGCSSATGSTTTTPSSSLSPQDWPWLEYTSKPAMTWLRLRVGVGQDFYEAIDAMVGETSAACHEVVLTRHPERVTTQFANACRADAGRRE